MGRIPVIGSNKRAWLSRVNQGGTARAFFRPWTGFGKRRSPPSRKKALFRFSERKGKGMAITDELAQLHVETLAAIEAAQTTAALDEVRVAVVGKR